MLNRIVLHISSGHGPDECQLAAKHALRQLCKEATDTGCTVQIVEEVLSARGLHSATVALEGDYALAMAQHWVGTLQWNCPSPFRPKHLRKNWFIGVQQLNLPQELPRDDAIVFSTCKSSGKGGQHVNKTESAVHATHIATGIKVKVQTERSQFANKKLARELLAFKLQELQHAQLADRKKDTNALHWNIERGNPIRIFRGPTFQSQTF